MNHAHVNFLPYTELLKKEGIQCEICNIAVLLQNRPFLPVHLCIQHNVQNLVCFCAREHERKMEVREHSINGNKDFVASYKNYNSSMENWFNISICDTTNITKRYFMVKYISYILTNHGPEKYFAFTAYHIVLLELLNTKFCTTWHGTI